MLLRVVESLRVWVALVAVDVAFEWAPRKEIGPPIKASDTSGWQDLEAIANRHLSRVWSGQRDLVVKRTTEALDLPDLVQVWCVATNTQSNALNAHAV